MLWQKTQEMWALQECIFRASIFTGPPFGGRAHEYFSEDPYLSGVSVEYEVKGLQEKGVTPYVKHFAFDDEEDQRIGIGIWLNEQSAREIYLRPFEYAVSPSKGNAHGIMSSFNRAGCIGQAQVQN